MKTLFTILFPAGLLLLSGCALRFPDEDSFLDKSTVDIRGDTAVYKGFYRNGGIRSEITLVNGTANGPSRLFYPNGAVAEKSAYRNGGKEGECISYFLNGIRYRQDFFVRDTSQADRRMRFDSTGRQISEWASQGDTASVSFFKDGKWDTANAGNKAGHGKYDVRSTESILKVIRRKTNGLRHIYNAHLRPNRFRGKVTFKFAIRPDGRITYLLVLGNTTGNHRFARDVANAIQGWKFEAIETKSNDTITVPFTFSE